MNCKKNESERRQQYTNSKRDEEFEVESEDDDEEDMYFENIEQTPEPSHASRIKGLSISDCMAISIISFIFYYSQQLL